MANGHVKYDPTTGSVEAYAPRFRAINPDDFLSTVRAAIVQAGKMQALDSSPGSLQTPVGKLDLGAGTSQFLGKMRENEAVRQIKKDGPDRYFKGKHRSELSPKLKRLYDQVERQKKKSGFKSDLTGGLGRVLDVLSRFNYGSAEAVSRVWHKSMENDDDSWLENLGEAFVDAGEGFVSGVKGKDKTTFGKVIQEMMDSKEALKDGKDPNKVRYGYAELGTGEKIMKGVAGFTFDVLLDPTTYVGVGMIKAGLKAGKGATAAPKEVDNLVSKLVDEYGIEDINGAKMQDPKTGIGHFLNQNAVMGEAASTGSAQAKTARLRDSLLFAKTARATVMAKEFSRLRETLRTQRHSEYMFLDDTVETSQPMLLDVPMTSEEVAQLAKLRMEHGSLSSEIAKTSKQINELKSRLGAAHPEKAPGKKNNVNAPKGEKGVNANNKVDRARPIKAGSTVPTLGVGAKKAIEKQIAELEARKAALQGESKKLSAKIKDEFNGIDAPPELFASAKALVDEHPDIKNLDRQIRNTRDSLRKTEKRNNRKDAKAAKVDKTTPAAKGAKDEAAATERLADLKARREQRIVELMDEALAKIAPDKGTLTAVVRREDDAKILQRLVDATDPASVQAARRELAYRFAEKGDAWLNSIVQHASKHNDGLVEDLRNLTPLKRPGKHTVRKRQLVVQETPTKVHSKAELARIGKHNKALDKEIDDLAAKQADEIAEGIEDQLLEILIRETTPAFKRGLSVKLNMPFTKANSPETAKVLFTLALPDAVSAAVGKYVFRDTFKEGVTRWANFFKSSAGTDPLMNAMRLAYNGAANFRIEEHAKRLRNMWQHVAPAERRAGFRQWLRHGHLIDENTPGPYATLVQQINDEVSAIGRMFSTTYPDGIKITPSDFNAWLPDKMKFAALKGPDTKLPVGSPEWVRASLRHTEEEIDPAELLWHLHIAREKTLVRTAMKDNVVNLFGLERKAQSEQLIQKLIRKGYKEVPEIGGKYFFPPEVADDISKTFDLMKNQRTTNELIRYYDSVLTVYKSTVTMWNPGYHMRNSFGDGFMNYLAGVSGKSGLDSYRYSAKIIKALKGVGPESPVHAALMDINPKSAFATLENKPSTVLWTTKDGRKVTAEEVWVLYNHYGLHSGFVANEFGTGFGRPGTLRASTVGQKATDANRAVQSASEHREDFFRLAHFVHHLKESKVKSLDGAAFDAAASVRKYLFDYSDFTQIEKATMLRLIPFYKWTRKAIPLMGEMMFAQPGKALMYPKAMRNISMMLGYDLGDNNGVIPASDVIIPEWVRNRGMWPIGEQDGSTVMADVNLPFNDVVRTASSPLDSFFNMLTPGVRIPVELKMGRKFYGGIPVDDKTDYAASSIPQTSFLMQMMKKNANDEANGVAGTLLDPRTIQFLSGIGLHENTERQMNNELRGQSYDAAQAIKKKKEVGK